MSLFREALEAGGAELATPASIEAIRQATDALHTHPPKALVDLWKLSDGARFSNSVSIYSTSDIGERNRTFNVSEYAPAWVLIGDDGGGRGVLLDAKQEVRLTDLGDMTPEAAIVLSPDFTRWVEAGCVVDPPAANTPPAQPAVIELVRQPASGLSGLVRVREALNLSIGVPDLKRALASLPVTLLTGVNAYKFKAACELINRTERCLRIRSERDPSFVFLDVPS